MSELESSTVDQVLASDTVNAMSMSADVLTPYSDNQDQCNELPHNLQIKSACIQGCLFGQDVTILNPVNLYDCTLHDQVFIGPFVEIQMKAVIGTTATTIATTITTEIFTTNATTTTTTTITYHYYYYYYS
jgi:hypothetical protein